MHDLSHFLYARPETGLIIVWWCLSVWVSVWLSVRPFSTLLSYMLWHIELKFCTWLCFNILQIKFECHHFASIFEGVKPLCELRIQVMCSLTHFSPTYFHIFNMTLFKCTTDQVWVSSLIVNFYTPVFKQVVLWYGDVRPGLFPSDSLSIRVPIFRIFLLHALTYWAEILHMTLF